jgi:hypothetical protein
MQFAGDFTRSLLPFVALALTTYAWGMLHLYGLIFSGFALGALVLVVRHVPGATAHDELHVHAQPSGR